MPDDPAALQAAADRPGRRGTADLVLTSGGTGLSPRDRTPQATAAVLDYEVPGIRRSDPRGLDCAREDGDALARGRRRSPSYADRQSSRAVRKRSREALDVVLPVLPHALDLLGDRGRATDESTSRASSGAEAYLLGTIDETISPRTSYKLDRMRAFLRALGDPHRAYPTIHVGGTSGKGSTSTMIAAALQAAGQAHRPAHEAAPPLDDRARAHRRRADRARALRRAARRDDAGDRAHDVGARAPDVLRNAAGAGVRVLRRGARRRRGDRSRARRTARRHQRASCRSSRRSRRSGSITPRSSATRIEAIALEKAGIAKPGVPLVLGSVPPRRARGHRTLRRGSRRAGRLVRDVVTDRGRNGDCTARLDLHTARDTYASSFRSRDLSARERGDGDRRARAARRPAARSARRSSAASRTLAIPGRMEFFARIRRVVFDIAHNAEKAAALVASLRERFPGRRIHYVVAIGESKDARRILRDARAAARRRSRSRRSRARGASAIPPRALATIAESFGELGARDRAIPSKR